MKMTAINFLLILLSLALASHTLASPSPNETQTSNISDFNQSVLASRKAAEDANWTSALKHSSNSLVWADDVLVNLPKQLAALHYNHGVLLHRAGKYRKATKTLRAALNQYETLYGEQAIELQPLLVQLGLSLGVISNRQSLGHFNRAKLITAEHHGKNSAEYARVIVDQGVNYSRYFSHRKGTNLLQQGRDLIFALEGENSTLAAWASFNLGKISMSQKKWRLSSDHFLNALNTFELPDQPSNSIELLTHAFLVKAFSEQDKQVQATRHCLAIGKMTPASPNQDKQPLYKKPPIYPSSALYQGKSGWAIVEFDIDSQGFVRDPRVVKSSHSVFNKNSENAALKFRYAPSFENGMAVVTKNVKNKFIYHINK